MSESEKDEEIERLLKENKNLKNYITDIERFVDWKKFQEAMAELPWQILEETYTDSKVSER